MAAKFYYFYDYHLRSKETESLNILGVSICMSRMKKGYGCSGAFNEAIS